jgi:large subunit ribosomal protein L18
MGNTNSKADARYKRKRRIRKKVTGTAQRPRLSVFRSARHIYAQIIDDTAGRTVASASTVEKTVRERDPFESKKAVATFVGQTIAQRAKAQGIERVVFDRNGFLYHGRIKALSEGARAAGLIF